MHWSLYITETTIRIGLPRISLTIEYRSGDVSLLSETIKLNWKFRVQALHQEVRTDEGCSLEASNFVISFRIVKEPDSCTRPVTEGLGGGGWRGECHQNKICFCRFQLFYRSYKWPWLIWKWKCPFSRKNYQSGYICHGSHVNMCMGNKVFVVVKFTYS